MREQKKRYHHKRQTFLRRINRAQIAYSDFALTILPTISTYEEAAEFFVATPKGTPARYEAFIHWASLATTLEEIGGLYEKLHLAKSWGLKDLVDLLAAKTSTFIDRELAAATSDEDLLQILRRFFATFGDVIRHRWYLEELPDKLFGDICARLYAGCRTPEEITAKHDMLRPNFPHVHPYRGSFDFERKWHDAANAARKSLGASPLEYTCSVYYYRG